MRFEKGSFGRAASALDERGTILVLALLMLFIASVLALSLIFVTESEMRTSTSYEDHAKALMIAEAGVQEALWRLRLTQDNTNDPMTGSRVTGYNIGAGAPAGTIATDDAYINPDRWKLTSALVEMPQILKKDGDKTDNDGDGAKDEVDELNLWRDWNVKIVYANYDNTLQVFDDQPNDATNPAGAPRGDQLILPSVMSANELVSSSARSAGSGSYYYTTTDPADANVLTMRFLKESDLGPDFDQDGLDELVFYDEDLPKDSKDSEHSIRGGRTMPSNTADGIVDNESPYNINWSAGGANLQATGFPVLVITATGRVVKNGKLVATRTIESRFSYKLKRNVSTAICTCEDLSIGGNIDTHSYDSCGDAGGNNNGLCDISEVATCSKPWTGCTLNNPPIADVGTNNVLTLGGSSILINGSAKGVEQIVVSGGPTLNGGIAQSRGTIGGGTTCAGITFSGTPNETPTCQPNQYEMEDVCACINIDAVVAKGKAQRWNVWPEPSPNYIVQPSYSQAWRETSCSGAGVVNTLYADNSGEPTVGNTNGDFWAGKSGQYAYWWFQEGGHYYFNKFHVRGGLSSGVRILAGKNGPNGATPVAYPNCDIPASDRPDISRPVNFYVKTTYWMGNSGETGNDKDDYLVFEKLRPSEFIIWYAGINQDSGGSAVEYDFGPSKFKSTFIGPKSTVKFSGNADFAGTLVAKLASGFGGNPAFYYDKSLNTLFKGTNFPNVVGWREIQ